MLTGTLIYVQGAVKGVQRHLLIGDVYILVRISMHITHVLNGDCAKYYRCGHLYCPEVIL